MESVKNKKKTSNAAESIPRTILSNKKTPKSLKPKPKIVKKTENQDSSQTKETKTTSQVQARNEHQKKTPGGAKQETNNREKGGGRDINLPHGNKEKKITNESLEETPKSLKPKPKIVKKLGSQNSSQTKGGKLISQVKARNEHQKKTAGGGKQETYNGEKDGGRNINLPHGNKEKNNTNEKLEETPKSLKPKPEIVKKTENQKSSQTKEAKITLQVQARDEHQKKITGGGKQEAHNSEKDGARIINLPHGNIEKKTTNEKLEERSKLDQKAEKDIGGFIFMCNSKTKPDCFRYQVMGVPTNKQELVMGIKPGLKLFLYDFDLKILYGIYNASSTGGLKLEPSAFGGAFPAQVRFKVHKDCLPLPESIFKKALKENYNEKRHKFNTQLTVQQVKKLTELFQPAPLLHSNAQSSLQELTSDYERNQHPTHPISPHVSSPDPLFLTEKEYRSYGLQRERPVLKTATAPISSTSDKYRTDTEKEQLQRKEASHLDPLFLSEKEYRAYGLRRELPTAVAPPIERDATDLDNYPKDRYYTYDYSHDYGSSSLADRYLPAHDYGSSSLAARYLPLPRTVAAPSESYSLTAREAYTNDFNYMESETRNYQGRVVSDDTEGLYSSHASRALSEYNQKYHHSGSQSEITATPVTSRYSFPGPSMSYHR